jgi:hypothetical protein
MLTYKIKLIRSQKPLTKRIIVRFNRTSPMCPNGYGCFYNFQPNRIWLWITAFRNSKETSMENFTTALELSLNDLHNLLSQDSKNSNL